MEINREFCSDIACLISNVGSDTFKQDILHVMGRYMGIDHFAVFVFERNHLENLTASMVEGVEDKNLLNQNATVFVRKLKQHMWLNPELFESGSGGQEEEYPVYRYSPDQDDDLERRRLYQQSHTREKIFMVTPKNNKFFITNFFRHIDKDELSVEEFEQLKPLFPLVNNLIILRHELCGSDDDKDKMQSNLASLLKERGAALFTRLSQRETEVCDGILRGMTAEAIAAELNIAVSSVSTLRKRAYDKIGITSKAQLFALAINSHL